MFKSKLSEIGMLRLIPKMLALIAVQRQTAASRSTRPWMRVQHGVTGGVPRVTLSRELSTLAHKPILRASLGHEAEGLGLGLGLGLGFGFGFGFGFGLGLGLGLGFGFGLGLGLGLGEGQEPVRVQGFGFGLGEGQEPVRVQALTKAKKRMLSARKRASDAELFEPISQILIAFDF
ncbi:hypothetical protein Q3G72_005415 [Acer saccharum]|nr:hypothetical protein Q3G72_005415 [Acer saccharum]